MHPERLELSIATAATVLFLSVLYLWIQSAAHPIAATGIAIQTLAGFFASVQLWANNSSDALLKWCALQIERRRWGVFGLLDGRLRSLLLASLWYLLVSQALELLTRWDPPPLIGCPLAIVLLLAFVLAVVVLLLAVAMVGAVRLNSGGSAPRGRALIALRDQLRGNDWVWPMVGLAFLVGGMLQISAA